MEDFLLPHSSTPVDFTNELDRDETEEENNHNVF